MTRLKCILTITMVVCLIIVLVVIENLQMRKEIVLSHLDMSQTPLPSQLACTWYTSDLKWDYQLITNEKWYEVYVASPDVDIRAFQWSDTGEGSVIHLAIVNYGYPIVANINYFLLDPAKRQREVYPNFRSASMNIAPKSWKWKNEMANKEAVQCGNGTEEKCYGWFYRATYGQYYLYIYYDGPDCYENFEKVVQSINQQFLADIR